MHAREALRPPPPTPNICVTKRAIPFLADINVLYAYYSWRQRRSLFIFILARAVYFYQFQVWMACLELRAVSLWYHWQGNY